MTEGSLLTGITASSNQPAPLPCQFLTYVLLRATRGLEPNGDGAEYGDIDI